MCRQPGEPAVSPRALLQAGLNFLQTGERILLVLVGAARAADADHADDLVIDLDEYGSGAGEVGGA